MTKHKVSRSIDTLYAPAGLWLEFNVSMKVKASNTQQLRRACSRVNKLRKHEKGDGSGVIKKFSGLCESEAFAWIHVGVSVDDDDGVSAIKSQSSYSLAWGNVIPVKEGESVSVYISQPVPWR
jgi:hypothetical protein